MKIAELPHRRLRSQGIAGTAFDHPAAAVRWLGAIQAQDYLGSLWAIGLRTRDATQVAVEQAVAERTIVRTWPMRGTLHFVAAEDVRWMLELLTPRVVSASARQIERRFQIDRKVLARCGDLVARALEGGRRLTRDGLYQMLGGAKIATAGGRGGHIVQGLAHCGLICFGPRDGKQPTLVLLDEWVPGSRQVSRDEALAELARRYFTSRGPATVRDFAWWSGLSLRDASQGLAQANGSLVSFQTSGGTYWASPEVATDRTPSAAVLLPPFDEYTVAYRDRSAVLAPPHRTRATGLDLLKPTIVVNGRVVGFWGRRFGKDSVAVELQPFSRLGPRPRRAVEAAIRRYRTFLQRSDDGT